MFYWFLVVTVFFQSCKISKSLIIDDYYLFERELIPKIIPYSKIDSWTYYSDIEPWYFDKCVGCSFKEMGKLFFNSGPDTLRLFPNKNQKWEIKSNLHYGDIYGFVVIAYKKNDSIKIIDERHELSEFIGYIDNIQEAVLVLRSNNSSYYSAITNFTKGGSALLEYKKTRKYIYFPVDFDPDRFRWSSSILNNDAPLKGVERDYKYICRVDRYSQDIQILEYESINQRFVIRGFENSANPILLFGK